MQGLGDRIGLHAEPGGNGRGLVVLKCVGNVHRGELCERLDDGETDEVREAHLATASAREVVVDDDAIVHEELGRNRAHR